MSPSCTLGIDGFFYACIIVDNYLGHHSHPLSKYFHMDYLTLTSNNLAR